MSKNRINLAQPHKFRGIEGKILTILQTEPALQANLVLLRSRLLRQGYSGIVISRGISGLRAKGTKIY